MNLRLYLDGMLVPLNEHSDLADAEIVLRKVRTEFDEGVSTSFTSNITFTGAAFQYLKDKLITSPNARTNTVTLEVEDNCCKPKRIIYRGAITVKTIDWCEYEDRNKSFCAINADSLEQTSWNTAMDCVKSKIISEDFNGFWYKQHPHVRYCNELRPSYLRSLIIIIGSLLLYLMVSLLPVLYAIGIIIGIVNLILALIGGGSINDATSSLVDPLIKITNVVFDDIPRFMIGCGLGHPSPLIRSYIQNVCDQCGLSFQSSILNNPTNSYFNLVLFNAPNIEGDEDYIIGSGVKIEFARDYFTKNAPIWTGAELLNKLGTVFNADWTVEGTVLKFEQNTVTASQWIDLTIQEDKIIKICYKYDDEPFPRMADLKYSNDGLDNVGDEGLFLYNDLVPFDNPLAANQKGKKTIQFEFGAARFRSDGITPDFEDQWAALLIVLGGFVSILALVLTDKERLLLLANGKSAFPKLLVLENNYDISNARVVSQPSLNPDADFDYNIPMWVAAAFYNPIRYAEPPNTKKIIRGDLPGGGVNLWQFHQEIDPINQPNLRGVTFEVEIDKNCEDFNTLFSYLNPPTINFNLTAKLPYAGGFLVGQIEQISIKNNSFTITGTA